MKRLGIVSFGAFAVAVILAPASAVGQPASYGHLAVKVHLCPGPGNQSPNAQATAHVAVDHNGEQIAGRVVRAPWVAHFHLLARERYTVVADGFTSDERHVSVKPDANKAIDIYETCS